MATGMTWLGCAAVAGIVAMASLRGGSFDGPLFSAQKPVDPLVTGSVEPQPRPYTIIDKVAAGDRNLLKKAIATYAAGDKNAGDAIAQELTDPTLRLLFDWLVMRRGGATFDELVAFLDRHPDWAGARTIRRRAEERLFADRIGTGKVLAFFETAEPLTPSGRIALALAKKAEGRLYGAHELVRSAWAQDPLSPDTEDKVLEAFPDVLTRADHRARMDMLLFRKNFVAAQRSAARAGPEEMLIAKARIAVVGRARNAQAALDAVPASWRSQPAHLFSRVYHLRQQDKLVEAAKVLETVPADPEQLGDGDAWWDERRFIVRGLMDEKRYESAYRVAAGHGAASTADRIEAEFHAGWIALRFLDKPDLARPHFMRAGAIAETPISVTRAAYWHGRASEAAGLHDDARTQYERAASYPIAYYGQLAQARLGTSTAPLRTPDPLPDDRRAHYAASPEFRAIEILHEVTEPNLALSLYRDIAQTATGTNELLALEELATRLRDAKAMLAVGKIATQRGFPLDRAAFPTFGVPQAELIEGRAVERAMIHAIARQESAFDYEAQSPVGARGLMQLMPATARQTAQQSGLGYDVSRLTGDPAYNVKLGAAYLSDLMRAWRGSHILAFASYNAGAGNVKKWLARFGDPRDLEVDPVDWVEQIPFTETRNYVQRVMENLTVYRHLLGEEASGPTPIAQLSGRVLKDVKVQIEASLPAEEPQPVAETAAAPVQAAVPAAAPLPPRRPRR